MTWVTQFLRSFVHAGRGCAALFRTERNALIHLLATVLVVAAGGVLRIERWEWCAIVLAIAIVLAAEAINTAVETLLDRIHPERHPEIGAAKDLAAGGVLLAAGGAAVVGAIVFGPRLIAAFS